MKKFTGTLVWAITTSALGYMVYTGDFTYRNVIDAYLILMLTLATIFLPMLYIIIEAETDKKATDKLVNDFAEKGRFFGLLFMSVRSAISTVLLAMSGYALILAWYVIAKVMVVKFILYCKDKSANK